MKSDIAARHLPNPSRTRQSSADYLMKLGWYDVWTAEGDVGDGLVTVAYAGTKGFKNHFFRLIFSNAFFEHSWGRMPVGRIESRLRHLQPALIAHEANGARFFGRTRPSSTTNQALFAEIWPSETSHYAITALTSKTPGPSLIKRLENIFSRPINT